MKTDQQPNAVAVFLQKAAIAIAQLKRQLQQDYEPAYPALREIIHFLASEDSKYMTGETLRIAGGLR